MLVRLHTDMRYRYQTVSMYVGEVTYRQDLDIMLCEVLYRQDIDIILC